MAAFPDEKLTRGRTAVVAFPWQEDKMTEEYDNEIKMAYLSS